MATSHHDRVFTQAWAEHQHIRMVLGQIEGLLGHLEEKRGGQPSSGPLDVTQTRCGIRSLLAELRRSLALEGGNGEVAISLAREPGLDAQVTAATTLREVLQRQIGQLAEDSVDVHAESQVDDIKALFSSVDNGLKEYLSMRIDLLRRSLSSGHWEDGVTESASVSGTAEVSC